MAKGPIKVDIKTLGHTGVIIDQHPLEPSLTEDALRLAQNAMHVPMQESAGALKKRFGLKKFNQVAAGGAILGGIPMVVSGTGGAPVPLPAVDGSAGATDDTGGSIGTGDGTGSPGGQVDGSAAPNFDPGIAAFSTSQLFNGQRITAVGFANTAGGASFNGKGWWLAPIGWGSAASLVTSTAPGPPGMSAQLLQTVDLAHNGVLNPNDGFYYYILAHVESNDGSPTATPIRKTNGATDLLVATIPLNLLTTATHRTLSVQNMTMGNDGNIYIVVVDNVIDATNGRLFILNPLTGALTELNAGNISGGGSPGLYADFPNCCAFHEGHMYWGTAKRANDTSATINAITITNSIAYGSTDFSTSADQRFVNMTWMGELGGILYALTGQKTAGTAQRAVIMIRQPFFGIGAANAWTTVDIVAGGDTPTNLNFYCSACLFNGKVYVSHYDSNIARIFAFTPGVSAGVQTLLNGASVFNSTGTSFLVPFELRTDGQYIYAWGSTGSGGRNAFIVSTDGVTWTDKTSNFGQVSGEFPNQNFLPLSQ